jgi:Fe-S cluster assembly protein SufD
MFECKIKDINSIVLDLNLLKTNQVYDNFNVELLSEDEINIRVKANIHSNVVVQIIDLQKNSSNSEKTINVIAEANSKINILHCDESCDETICKSNSCINFILKDNSSLNYFHFDNVNNASAIKNKVQVAQHKNSVFNQYFFSFNAKNIDRDVVVELIDEYAEHKTKALYLLDKNQEYKTEIKVSHLVSNCKSQQLFKGVLDDSAKAEFAGHIFVNKDAQKTEAYQLNKNILLTDKAKIKTEPFLEIYADDVKCSHGSTVGQLDKDAIFYMRSRGITEKDANNMLMYAFANEITSEIEINPLSLYIQNLIRRRLNGEDLSCESCKQNSVF